MKLIPIILVVLWTLIVIGKYFYYRGYDDGKLGIRATPEEVAEARRTTAIWIENLRGKTVGKDVSVSGTPLD